MERITKKNYEKSRGQEKIRQIDTGQEMPQFFPKG